VKRKTGIAVKIRLIHG